MIGAEARLLFSGYTVLCTAPDGSIDGGRQGLFHRDTRVLSRYRLTVGGLDPQLVAQAQPENNRWDAVLQVPRPGGSPEGPRLPQDTLEVTVRRTVGPGLLETIVVRNHSMAPCETSIAIDVGADFADVAELDTERRQQGHVSATPEPNVLQFDYLVEHEGRRVERGSRLEIEASTTPASVDHGGVRFDARLESRGEWRATLRLAPRDGDAWPTPASLEGGERARQRDTWRRRRPAFEGPASFTGLLERAADDLFDLRNWELEERFLGSTRGAAWVTNAGVPTFTGLFGRDVITTGWQSAMLGTRALRGALEAVAATQATADDAWRDAEPGKLVHELRSGPLVELGLSPRDAYYGSQTTPAMFLLGLSELWHWTGDEGLLRRHRDTALRALAWAAQFGDADGDGLLEYSRRSPEGLRNQGWKDSDEAIRYPDGEIVDGPIATVEEQAFHGLALERMAEILVALGDDARADDFLARATDLRRRWHEAYWMADEEYYALALDGSKQQVRSIASNPGHALGTGHVPAAHARAVADRLLNRDLLSPWGVRSVSSDHPSYNPFAYHLGAVWPVEQATFALGCKRYGLDEHVDRLVGAILAAARRSPGGRLPEALSGQGVEDLDTPVPYPRANSPQAWSASAVVQIVQVMLGLYPFAPLHVLAVIRPRLPAWLPELTVRRLRVGGATVDLAFRRRDDGSASWHVIGRSGRIAVLGAGPPQDVNGGRFLERLEYGLLSRAPGRLARAARIAFGVS
jgi:glycogen debranching enzyme